MTFFLAIVYSKARSSTYPQRLFKATMFVYAASVLSYKSCLTSDCIQQSKVFNLPAEIVHGYNVCILYLGSELS